MSEPEMIVNTTINHRDQLYRIDVVLRDLVAHQRVRDYLASMLQQVVKTALMERYSEISTIVDEVIYSPETKELIKEAIRLEVKRMVEESIKEMFGKEK